MLLFTEVILSVKKSVISISNDRKHSLAMTINNRTRWHFAMQIKEFDIIHRDFPWVAWK